MCRGQRPQTTILEMSESISRATTASPLQHQRFKRFSLLQAPPRAPPPTWPTFRIDARYSVTSVEKVEQGIWPGRCANVTLGWRTETERQVVVGHTRTHAHARTHTRTRMYTDTYTYIYADG